MNEAGRRGHDIGGKDAGCCERDEHELQAWERRADALGEVIWGKAALIKVDELRRLREDLGPNAYDDLGYYERWMHSLAQGLIEHGVFTVEELARAMSGLEALPAQPAGAQGPARLDALFGPGTAVRVIAADAPGHIRTPWYCRGKRGTIVELCGFFPNPEELAYAREGAPLQPLYRVAFRAAQLWPDTPANDKDQLEIDIYQHWLERTS